MAARTCPHCGAEVTASNVVAFTNGTDCPKCAVRLEVTPGGRTISSLSGLAAGAIAWSLASGSTSDLGGVLPTLYAFLTFGIMSALVMMFTAGLRNAPAMPVPEPAHAGGGHAAAGQDAGAHGGHH